VFDPELWRVGFEGQLKMDSFINCLLSLAFSLRRSLKEFI
jgi:hypothetical protein